jgi:uncharacterized membrane protein YqjE
MNSFRETSAALLDYVHARLSLVRIEAREATSHAAITAGLAVGGFVVLVFSYLFLVLAGVFALSQAFESPFSWAWAALIAFGLHLAAAAVLILLVVRRIKRPVFQHTIAELRKDKGWLKTTKTN